jgi:hypothetical protein
MTAFVPAIRGLADSKPQWSVERRESDRTGLEPVMVTMTEWLNVSANRASMKRY